MTSPLRLWNTRTRTLERFEPIEQGKVGIYSCGPTVYSRHHLGNFRAYIFSDTLRRLFELHNYSVKHVMNVTDVGHLTSDGDEGEDKLEVAKQREGSDAWSVASKYTKHFFEDAKAFGILDPHIVCKATDYIPHQIALVKTLEEKGFTYSTKDGVYFDASRFPRYPDFARLRVESLEEGIRVDKGEKRNPTDFALWKFAPTEVQRDMEWESPWGKGFPGWHLECSAMAMHHLGCPIDIHTGGIDHISVHHTNEIAQSEGATGISPWVRYWLHCEFLVTPNDAKLSKSTGGAATLDTLQEEGIHPGAYRLFVLSAHYRQQARFSLDAVRSAQQSLMRLAAETDTRTGGFSLGSEAWEAKEVTLSPHGRSVREAFIDALSNDLNTPQAIAVVWNTLRDTTLASEEIATLLLTFEAGLGLFSFLRDLRKGKDNEPIPDAIQALFEERQTLRLQKRYAEADSLRLQLLEKGFVIEDSKSGSRVLRQ
jgi:cysteinyl-tRNA synthetase